MLAVGLWRGTWRAAEVSVAALCLIAAARLVHGMSPIDMSLFAGVGTLI